jgi:hypothetical protein
MESGNMTEKALLRMLEEHFEVRLFTSNAHLT